MSEGYGVAVYEIDLVYGGPEEGGWYFNTGTLVHSEIAGTEEMASKRAIELAEGEYRSTARAYWVNYRGGQYSVRVTHPGKEVPEFYPEVHPSYE